jgi:DnaJ-class molecular chaperone
MDKGGNKRMKCPIDGKPCELIKLSCQRQGKVQIVCHTCDGIGVITEKEYPTFKYVNVVCPECNGEGWIYAELPKVKRK